MRDAPTEGDSFTGCRLFDWEDVRLALSCLCYLKKGFSGLFSYSFDCQGQENERLAPP